jgi:hypothetical protein
MAMSIPATIGECLNAIAGKRTAEEAFDEEEAAGEDHGEAEAKPTRVQHIKWDGPLLAAIKVQLDKGYLGRFPSTAVCKLLNTIVPKQDTVRITVLGNQPARDRQPVSDCEVARLWLFMQVVRLASLQARGGRGDTLSESQVKPWHGFCRPYTGSL